MNKMGEVCLHIELYVCDTQHGPLSLSLTHTHTHLQHGAALCNFTQGQIRYGVTLRIEVTQHWAAPRDASYTFVSYMQRAKNSNK